MTSATEDRDGKSEEKKLGAKNPAEFFQQVRQEGRKVTWATRQEVTVSAIMVLILVSIAAIFFFLVDSGLRALVPLILRAGG
jgi:preprotein translocase subunit SecE